MDQSKSARQQEGAADQFRQKLIQAGVMESYADFLTENGFKQGELGIYPDVDDCVKAALPEVPDIGWQGGSRPPGAVSGGYDPVAEGKRLAAEARGDAHGGQGLAFT